jgi:septal ring factor EnvC (AmiA/AmiB activator)
MKKLQKQLDEIEETQKALRDSIEESKRLSDKSDRLIHQHRQDLNQGGDAR